jgi:hypothetical protein
MVPHVALQSTAAFAVPATVAANCCVPLGARLTVEGSMVTVIGVALPSSSSKTGTRLVATKAYSWSAAIGPVASKLNSKSA